MPQNQTVDWFPQSTGNAQYDDNQRRIWQSLYYLRDQHNNAAAANGAGERHGMSGTIFFAGGFTMGKQTFYSMVFKDGRLVSVA